MKSAAFYILVLLMTGCSVQQFDDCMDAYIDGGCVPTGEECGGLTTYDYEETLARKAKECYS